MSVPLHCGSGDTGPICTPEFPDGEHQSLTLGMKEKCTETWLHLYFPCHLDQALEPIRDFLSLCKAGTTMGEC